MKINSSAVSRVNLLLFTVGKPTRSNRLFVYFAKCLSPALSVARACALFDPNSLTPLCVHVVDFCDKPAIDCVVAGHVTKSSKDCTGGLDCLRRFTAVKHKN